MSKLNFLFVCWQNGYIFQSKNIKLLKLLKKKQLLHAAKKIIEFPDLEGVENLFLEMLIFFVIFLCAFLFLV